MGHCKLCVPALVGQEDPGMDNGSPAAQPDNLTPLAQEVESHEPLKHEVEVSAPLAQEVEQHEPLEQETELHNPPDQEVELHEDRSLLFSDILHRDLEPAQTTREEENASYEEDTEGDNIDLLATLEAVSPTQLGHQPMDGDLPNKTEMEEAIPICHQLGTDMIVPATDELGEVHDEDTLVLRDSLHHPERVPPDGLSVHHVAPVMCPTQTSIAPTSTSRSHSSCTTPLPWTAPPPTTFTMSPGSPSSPLEPSPTGTQPPFEGCSSTDGGENYDELGEHLQL